jgi:biopolymer transport protein ExbD
MSIRSQSKVRIEGGMSSMTDLVFLMLIFFVVLSTMVSTGHGVELPKSAEGDPGENKNTKVYVTKDNQYFIGEKSTTPIDVAQLEESILTSLGNENTVELLGDKESNWQYTIAVLDIVKKNGLKIVIKTTSQ